ncbi:MAG: double-stranded DNA-binding protein [Thaumarchaeota archaeon]|nr:MAG: double-stranded DNA-binding protein [Nitrososphaerota archaeon]TLY11902.1 MAG: double-stranded DNA-binding protein [Nitrososphaerota archaeon]
MTSEDPDIEIIKARKLKELREKAAAVEKAKSTGQQKKKSARDIVSGFLYDRGDEVLNLAYMQYPVQTEAIVTRIAELMQSGEITSRISGGELLALFRSVGLNVRVKTTIKVEDKGKLISFSDKLKQQND